jgi:tripartite-type tricarboxylate transporter receptor subunit TctC
MNKRRKLLIAALAAPALTAPFLARRASAQAWPSRAVRIIAPLPPGGSYDYLARVLGEHFRQAFNQPFVIENRVGADGRIGVEHVARQPADGYTFLIISSTQVVQPSLFTKIPYDILRDFEPVGLIAKSPFVLVVHPSVAADSVAAYIALARSKPGHVTFGSSGVGSPFHLGAELLKVMARVDMLHVPYKGSGPLIQGLLSGDVMSAFASLGPVLPHIRAGKLRALGIVDSTRTAVLPDTPTIAEAAPLPGYALDAWLGLVAPAGTPRPVIERINTELVRVIRDPQFAEERLRKQSYDPIASTPSQMAEVMRADHAKFAALVRDAKIPAE